MADWWRGRPVGHDVLARTALAAAVFGALAGSVPGRAALVPAYVWLALLAAPLTVIDLALHRLPDRLMVPLAVGGAALVSAGLLAHDTDVHTWLRAVEAAAAVFAVLFLLAFVAPRSFGLGDVKLGGVLGGYLGVAGWAYVYYGIFAGFVLGTVVAIVVLATRRGGMKTAIPFGPMLVLGALLVLAFHLVPSLFTTG
ncbi:MAG: prepilin peptidase [Jatrophihabitans endophyticus]|nr:prepilin peptidase [Jatrophihabitans endophyticus]